MLSLTEFAALVGVSKMTISDACRPGGRLEKYVSRGPAGRASGINNPEAAARAFRENADHTKVGAARLDELAAERRTSDEDDGDDMSVSGAAGRAKHWDAKLKELKYREAAAELVPAAGVRSQLVNTFTTVRTRLMGVPSRAKQSMPELSVEQVAKLENLIREALEELVQQEAPAPETFPE